MLELTGSNYEIGMNHGVAFREGIRELVRSMLEEVQMSTGLGKDSIYHRASKFLPTVEDAAPHLADEIRGIAEGVGVPVPQILLLNHRHEFMYGITGRPRKWGGGCTILGVAPERSSTGGAILAQNVDLPPSFTGRMALFKLRPRRKESIMMCALIGTVGHHGMNSSGLARCASAMVTTDEKATGLSKVLLSRLILERKDVRNAVDIISRADRAVSSNYTLADRRGELVDVETTAGECREIGPRKGILVHTNHVVHAKLKPIGRIFCADSLPRYQRMTQLASRRDGKIAPRDVVNWLRDHQGSPGSICNHTSIASVASVVFQPKTGVMQACLGPPCQNEYHEFEF